VDDRRALTPSRLGAATAAALLGAIGLAACSDDSAPEAGSTTPTTVAASVTTLARSEPASATEVAQEFLEAYGEFDADRALTYLTDDAITTGVGHAGNWGSEDAFRLETAFDEAQAILQSVTGCEEKEAAAGTSVRCAFDLHAFHSDEIGLGPFTDNYWDIVVSDGKITSAIVTWAYLTNGFSAQLWTPFQTWVSSTHPEDIAAMYLGGNAAVTEESARLWEQRTREWADTQAPQ
jgi:hypothetical protein